MLHCLSHQINNSSDSVSQLEIVYPFSQQDIVVNGVLALIYLITGAVAGHYSSQWDDWVEYNDEFIGDATLEDELEAIRGSLGAICVSFQYPYLQPV